MAVEEFTGDNTLAVRAELPGIDPEKDVEVTVADGMLTIKAERREEHVDKHRSEFHYGTLSRSVTLPAGADEESIEAIYGHGILEVTVKLAAEATNKAARKIPVRQNQHIKAT